jgi:rhomboid protease GluP
MPLVVTGLIVINLIIFVLPYIINFKGDYGSSTANLLALGWKDNSLIKDGEWYRLITSGFLHGDILHIFFNMYSLWSIGTIIFNPVSSILTPLQFIILYFASLVGGSLASFFFNASPSVGASGAIFGLVGMLVVYSILNGDTQLLTSLGLNILLLAVIGFTSSNLDNWGHLGGFVTGAVVGYYFLVVA